MEKNHKMPAEHMFRTAVAGGATHLVVGRPIMAAPDPVAAAMAIRAEMAQ